MKVDGRAGEYSAPRGHLTVGRRSSAAVGERERERENAPVEGLNTSVVGRGRPCAWTRIATPCYESS